MDGFILIAILIVCITIYNVLDLYLHYKLKNKDKKN